MGWWHNDTGSTTGGYKGHSGRPRSSDPRYGSADGRKHDIIGYSEIRNAKTYSSQTQQVFQVRRAGGQDYIPPINDGSKRGNQHRLLASWLAAAPELHQLDYDEDSPVNVTAHSSRRRGAKSKPRKYGNSSEEDDSDGEDESIVWPAYGGRHDHNYAQVNPNIPVTTHYESKPLAAGPPPIKSGAAPDQYRKKIPTETDGEYLRPTYDGPSRRKGKGQNSSEARRRYGGVEAPAGGYSQEQHNNPIGCREAGEKHSSVFVPW